MLVILIKGKTPLNSVCLCLVSNRLGFISPGNKRLPIGDCLQVTESFTPSFPFLVLILGNLYLYHAAALEFEY